MGISKTGVLSSNTFTNSLINDFTATKSTQGWNLGGSLNSEGIAVLTGTAPNIQSPNFIVNPNDILRVEFDVKMVSPSSSGDGLYLGTQSNSNTIIYNYNNGWNSGTDNASSPWNTYFIYAFKTNADRHVVGYILGSNRSIGDINEPIANGTVAIKLKSDNTTFLRSGYNSNTTMTLHFWHPVVYKITGTDYIAGISNIDIKSNEFYEI